MTIINAKKVSLHHTPHPIQKRTLQSKKGKPLVLWIGGIGFTLGIALVGYVLSKIPGFDHLGPMACSILLAVVYRQIWGYPHFIRSGIQFSAAKLLRFAIILFGLKLNMSVLFHDGIQLLIVDAGVVIFSILFTLALAKRLKADLPLSLLVGIGTGVCGAAAIAAVSPVLQSKEEETAVSVGMIALVGTVFSILYTLLRPFIPLTETQYGIWAGVSLHEMAHVALAAEPAGQNALAVALLAKLGRVSLLVPLSLILMYWMKRTGKVQSGTKLPFPWFLIGFIVMSFFGSYVLERYLFLPTPVMSTVSNLTTFLLTMAMVGLGLNVDFADLRAKALRPLLAMSVTSVILTVITLVIIQRL